MAASLSDQSTNCTILHLPLTAQWVTTIATITTTTGRITSVPPHWLPAILLSAEVAHHHRERFSPFYYIIFFWLLLAGAIARALDASEALLLCLSIFTHSHAGYFSLHTRSAFINVVELTHRQTQRERERERVSSLIYLCAPSCDPNNSSKAVTIKARARFWLIGRKVPACLWNGAIPVTLPPSKLSFWQVPTYHLNYLPTYLLSKQSTVLPSYFSTFR